MKKTPILISLVILLLASPACSAGGATPATQAAQEPATQAVQEPTTVIEPTTPAATTVPTQEAVAVDGTPGPETIDLTDSALYITSSSPAYSFTTQAEFSGVDTTGAAKEVSLLMLVERQTQPQPTQHGVVKVTGGEGSAESVVIGDQVYIVFQGICNSTDLNGQKISDGMPDLRQEVKGQAQRVESGINVNGYVTDKYELTSENMVAEDELISAFVYVARDGGFITLFEVQGRTKTNYQGLDPNQLTDITTTYNYIPVEDGSFEVAIPAECNN
jgi:hypothetical protein